MAQSSVPVMMDAINGANMNKNPRVKAFNHVPGGGNVLYMDGHVDFMKYPGKYPMHPYLGYIGVGGTAGI